MDTILAVDINQIRTRVSLVARDGSIVASSESGFVTGRLGDWVEQEPRDWWLALTVALRSLRDANPDMTPSAVALCGQAGLVLLADDFDRLDAAMLPADRRATRQWQKMVEKVGLERLLRTSNNVYDEAGVLPRLLWLKDHQPTFYEKARCVFFGAHDYITWRMCGARVTDYATASATDLFDLQADTWATELLQEIGLRTDWFPQLITASERAGLLLEGPAKALGLPAGIPVFHGTSELATMVAGAGAVKPGQYVCYLGDSGWLATTGLHEMANPLTGLVNMRSPWRAELLVAGPMITAAGNFEWLKERFGEMEQKGFAEANMSTTELLMTLAAEAAPGSGGVVYLPYLAGEQSPYRDPNARGGWFFVHRGTWRSDLYRAVLEGVTYSLRAIQYLMPEPLPDVDEVELSLIGDENCSPLWATIFADVFNCRVELLSPPEDVSARGAAYIAGKALGWFAENLPPYDFLHSKGTFVPNAEVAEKYDRLFNVFVKLYPALHAAFSEVAQPPGA
ncbi:MAG: FGGY family carbohydrate kinase [Chloroflexi bacterium]|nr:FGGY family carbohydrate kinase [Chloroflexota bacterium]